MDAFDCHNLFRERLLKFCDDYFKINISEIWHFWIRIFSLLQQLERYIPFFDP